MFPLDEYVFDTTNFQDGPAPGDQDATGPRGLDGLVVHLLLVDDVFVVEGDVVRVEFGCDGGVEGVRRLGCFFRGHFGWIKLIISISIWDVLYCSER